MFDTEERAIVWIGLNPSTADENKLDPTLRRIRGYSKAWGYNTFYMLNIFAFRATNPRDMRQTPDPIGPDNDQWMLEMVDKTDRIMCAWGRHGMFQNRQDAVITRLKDRNLYYLEKTHDGIPKHPLYLKADLLPKPFSVVP